MSFKVKALYEYSSPHEDDLQFGSGQIITVTEEEDEDWYTGEYVDDSGVKHEGIFPRNFVEKYEPVAPPRPTRTRPKKEPEPAPEESAAAPEEPPAPEPEPVVEPEEPRISSPPPPPVEPKSPPIPATSPPAPKPVEPELPSSPPKVPVQPVVQSPPKEAPIKRGPPPVSEKPASSSFKDRIAAFNKAAAPIAPFKPSGLGGGGSSSFIKKPFVAPPPKGNTYVPQQRNTPIAPVYRREEDPEIKEKEAENLENAQKAGLLPSESKEAEEGQPKPMSLKERMALLQRQQQEQAQRHAEAAAKKEKPKRPAKPRIPSHETAATEGAEEEASTQAPNLERRDTGDTGGRRSIDESHPPRLPAQPRRKPSKDPEPRDGNEADMSGAGELTEGPEELTEREDSDEKPRQPSRVSTGQPAAEEEARADEDEEEEDDEEEDEEAKELRRKEELRARMARLGGGMGMPGMFGMPMPGAGPSLPAKKKKPAPAEKRPSEDTEPVASPRAPPVPMMMPLPGMGLSRKSTEEQRPAVEDEPAEVVTSPRSPPAGKSPHGTCLTFRANTSSAPLASPGAAPPVPGGRPAPPPVPTDCMFKTTTCK